MLTGAGPSIISSYGSSRKGWENGDGTLIKWNMLPAGRYLSSSFSSQARGGVPCLVPRPGRGLPAQGEFWVLGTAPCTTRKENVSLCSSYLLSTGVCRRRGVSGPPGPGMCIQICTCAFTHARVSRPHCATRSLSGGAGGAWALKLLFCNFREFGWRRQTFECDSHQRKGGEGGDGNVSEASTHQGCARQLSPSTAVTAAAIEVAKAASATTNASDPSERCR